MLFEERSLAPLKTNGLIVEAANDMFSTKSDRGSEDGTSGSMLLDMAASFASFGKPDEDWFCLDLANNLGPVRIFRNTFFFLLCFRLFLSFILRFDLTFGFEFGLKNWLSFFD